MKKYLRMTLNERVQHLNLFINFTILVITGFALKYPGVTSHPLALGYVHFFVGWRFQMRSGGGITPTLGATIAAQPIVWPWLNDRLSSVTPAPPSDDN